MDDDAGEKRVTQATQSSRREQGAVEGEDKGQVRRMDAANSNEDHVVNRHTERRGNVFCAESANERGTGEVARTMTAEVTSGRAAKNDEGRVGYRLERLFGAIIRSPGTQDRRGQAVCS